MKSLKLLLLLLALTSSTSLLAQSNSAQVQFIHNAPDKQLSQVDVYDGEGNALVQGFAFRSATAFTSLSFSGSTFELGIAPAGAPVADTVGFTLSGLQDGAQYAVAVNGILPANSGSYDDFQELELAVKGMARQSANSADSTAVLVHHGSPDAGSVDVAETSQPLGTLVSDLAYSTFNSGYATLETNDYTLEVTPNGANTVVGRFQAPLGTLNLGGGAAVVFASGFVDTSNNNAGPEFGLFAALPNGTVAPLPELEQARVQIIHNAPDTALSSVDIYKGGTSTLIAEDLQFRNATGFATIEFTGDTYELGIAPGGAPVADTVGFELSGLQEGGQYLAIANGILPANSADYAAFRELTLSVKPMARQTADAPDTATDVLIHHGSPGAPGVDVEEVRAGLGSLVTDLQYTGFSAGYTDVPTANYDLKVTPANSDNVVGRYRAPLANLGLGDSAITVMASGFLDPSANSAGPSFGLFAVLADGTVQALPEFQQAQVQLIHNAPDSVLLATDVYDATSGERIADDFTFRSATAFTPVQFSDSTFEVGFAPPSSQNVRDTVLSVTLENLQEGGRYVVTANGVLPADSSNYKDFRPFDLDVRAMARQSANSAGNTDVLIHHGSTDAPAVDITEVAVTNNLTLTSDLGYGQYTSGYASLSTNNYELAVTPSSGTDPVARFDAPLADLGLSGEAITVFASGFLDPSNNKVAPDFGLFATLADGTVVALRRTGEVQIQLIHNSPDDQVETIDVYETASGDRIADDLSFQEATAFQSLTFRDGTPDISLAPGNSTDTADAFASFTLPQLQDGGQYIVAANGILPGNSSDYEDFERFELVVKPMARQAANSSGNTDVIVQHGAPDAPPVDVFETGEGAGQLLDALAFGSFTDNYLELPIDGYELAVRPDGSGTAVARFDAPLGRLGLADSAITLFASGFLDPANNQGGPEFGILAALADGTVIPLDRISKLQLIHNIPDPAAEAVDVFINGDRIRESFTYKEATPYLTVPHDDNASVTITEPGNTVANPLKSFSLDLTADPTQVGVINGTVEDDNFESFQPVTLNTFTGARVVANEAGNTDLLVHHGSPDAGPVDIVETRVNDTATLLSGLAYPEFDDNYLQLVNSDYRLGLRSPDSMIVQSFEATLASANLTDSAVVAVASGFLDSADQQNGAAFSLLVATPGGNVLELRPTGLEQVQQQIQFQAYPNPVTDQLRLSFDQTGFGQARIDVVNMSGRVVTTQRGPLQGTHTLSMNELPSGTYVIRVAADGQTIGTRAVIKR